MYETGGKIDYTATTAASDGHTMIYVYFTRNIYTLKFHYYGKVTTEYCVATNTNGYSYAGAEKIIDKNGDLIFHYTGGRNKWRQTDATKPEDMMVPRVITIKAKYGADLRDVWPVARSDERAHDSSDNVDVRMISWATTNGVYRDNAMTPGTANYNEPTIMGSYAGMGSEIIAEPTDTDNVHHLIAYWAVGDLSYYRNNHCFEVPELNIASAGVQTVSIYRNSNKQKDLLYLVPTDNKAFTQFGFNDLMRVSHVDGNIEYDTKNGQYYAVRGYSDGSGTKYYAVARRVETVSTNAINKQNPSARQHMTRVTRIADHSSMYSDTAGAPGKRCGTEDDPYDLYFYYDRDRYMITYMAPVKEVYGNNRSEVTLGRIELPYGAVVTKDQYGFKLNYKDTNQQKEAGEKKYPWSTDGEAVKVCPDRSEQGTAEWTFRGWALGPSGVNMQWIPGNADAQGQVGEDFFIESNLRLYAVWEQPTYTVTFHLNGGSVGEGQSIRVSVPANERYSVSGIIPRPARSGYTLSGWRTADEDGTVSEPAQNFDFDARITDNQHVAAVWTSISTLKYSYNIYYVARTLHNKDQNGNFDTISIDSGKDEIVTQDGETYYVLKKTEVKDQSYVPDTTLHKQAEEIENYIPIQADKSRVLTEANQTYNLIFYYVPQMAGSHMVRFVEAGTETNKKPAVVKSIRVAADQTVVTPDADVVRELAGKGYGLVNKGAGGTYKAVTGYSDLTWIDGKGNAQAITTLTGDKIPDTVTYLIQPVKYTVTYQNAEGSPAAADNALTAVTSVPNTPVAGAAGKNPTQYTMKDAFIVKNPSLVQQDGKWYRSSHWNLGNGSTANTTLKDGTQYSTLRVDRGTVGNLTFMANWTEVTDTGSLTVSKTVAGNAGDTNRDFHFTVTLGDQTINGTYGDMEFTDGVAEMTLKHGESKTAAELPPEVDYTVNEAEADQDGYTTSAVGKTGIILEDGATAAFTNTRSSAAVDPDPGSKTGNVMVSMMVSGNQGDVGRDFIFTMTLGDTSIEGKYGDLAFHAGVAVFKLRHGERVTAQGLPAGLHYTVEESNNEGYVVKKSGERGVVKDGATTEALFRNHMSSSAGVSGETDRGDKPAPTPEQGESDKPAEETAKNPTTPIAPADNMPKTGDETGLALWLILMAVSCTVVIAVLVISRQQRKRSRS